MHFGAPFGIDFSIFSRNGKNAFGAYSFTDSMVFDHQKHLIFQSTNCCFFMFFQKRSKNQFLDVKGADRWSKVRFWSHFGTKGVSKNDPWEATFRPKGRLWCGTPIYLGQLFADPATHDTPKPPKIAFLSILVGFWTHFHRFWSAFGRILDKFGMEFS